MINVTAIAEAAYLAFVRKFTETYPQRLTPWDQIDAGERAAWEEATRTMLVMGAASVADYVSGALPAPVPAGRPRVGPEENGTMPAAVGG